MLNVATINIRTRNVPAIGDSKYLGLSASWHIYLGICAILVHEPKNVVRRIYIETTNLATIIDGRRPTENRSGRANSRIYATTKKKTGLTAKRITVCILIHTRYLAR